MQKQKSPIYTGHTDIYTNTNNNTTKINTKSKKNILSTLATKKIQAKKLLANKIHFAATHSVQEVLQEWNTTAQGLSQEQVEQSREIHGQNKVTKEKQKSFLRRLFESFINPFTAILLCLSLVSLVTDVILPIKNGAPPTPITVFIILTMVCLSGVLHFIQESRSGDAASKLMSLISTTCTVIRAALKPCELPLLELVEGDIVHLSVGDLIPADVRIIEAKDFFTSQAALTGESEPVEKVATPTTQKATITDYNNIAFMGSNVVSGTAKALVISVGDSSVFGLLASSIAKEATQTDFSKGINATSWLLIKFMLVMMPLVFLAIGLTKGNWLQAFLFAISVAVGLTPEMLPMIVTTCLAKGAVSMSKEKTIVKNLNAIQNFGAIDILCTDKTGTLTQDKVVLELHLNISGLEDSRVLRHAYLNSYFQTGYKNLMDYAIITKTEEAEKKDHTLLDLSENYTKIDEIPFDFARRRITTVVQDKKTHKTQMVTKGALEEMLCICSFAEIAGKVEPLVEDLKQKIRNMAESLNEKGFRVLAIAQKSNPSPVGSFGVSDEKDMVLLGYLAFLDPPKESTPFAIKALKEHGVHTKILTGDNEKVTKTICTQVGIKVETMLLGQDIQQMSDAQLEQKALECDVFARLTPEQKARVVNALRAKGHAVGFMGDGINDAAAMKASDIGISVDTACDIAKESADVILLEKDLTVLERGIIEGRKTYANMIKYIKMTASSNFGNMFSVLLAACLLPFIPMLPIHLILLNLIYDTCCTAIPFDNVDDELLRSPKKWDAKSVSSFMLWLGPVSSVFDWLTYAFLYFVFCPFFAPRIASLLGLVPPDVASFAFGVLYSKLTTLSISQDAISAIKIVYVGMFQAGWFTQSMWSQTLVIHMIRTTKLPFLQSRASFSLCAVTLSGILLLTMIPYTPLGHILGFVALPVSFFAYLVPCIMLYMIMATAVKKAYIKKYTTLL